MSSSRGGPKTDATESRPPPAAQREIPMSDAASQEPQAAPAVLMVRPARFGHNAETAGSNFFQSAAQRPGDEAANALREFDALALALARAGVRVFAFAGQHEAALPDEVFP